MESHKEVDVCGGSVTVAGRLIQLPTAPCLIRLHMLFYCSLAHPSVIWRVSSISPGYSLSREHRVCEDYRLWLDFLLCGKRFANLDGPALVHLRR
jgi:hypothetical protein